jgi:hypothetical protein
MIFDSKFTPHALRNMLHALERSGVAPQIAPLFRLAIAGRITFCTVDPGEKIGMRHFATARERRNMLVLMNGEENRPEFFPNIKGVLKRCAAVLIHWSEDLPNAVRECGCYGPMETSPDLVEDWADTMSDAGVECVKVVRS